MMIELLRRRRSIREYTGEPLDRQTVGLLVETLLRVPSSRNRRPWQFVLVDDPELLDRLANAKEHGSSFLKGAALAIVVCGDSSISDAWVEDCSIASIMVQMTAESLGLGTCWIQIRNRPHDSAMTAEEFIQNLLGIPKDVQVLSIVSVGYPGRHMEPREIDEQDHAKVRLNGYDTLFTDRG